MRRGEVAGFCYRLIRSKVIALERATANGAS
jgi:hypothetical protein